MILNREKSKKMLKIITSLTLIGVTSIGGLTLTDKILNSSYQEETVDNLNLLFQNEDFRFLSLEDLKQAINYKGIVRELYKIITLSKGHVNILKTKVMIKDIPFELYLVYDGNLNKEYLDAIEKICSYISRIDSEILLKISNTSIIIKEDSKLDYLVSNNEEIGAYSRKLDKSITVFGDLYLSDIIHELAHAYDYTFSYSPYHSVTDYESVDISTFLPFVHEEILGWKDLIIQEGENIIKKLSVVSGYTIDKYLEKPSEYFADCFYHYYLYPNERELFKEVAPKTYEALTTLINKDIEKYQKKK